MNRSTTVRRRTALLGAVALGACRGGPGGRTPVTREDHVAVDGASLYLLVRGADRRAPILLWLHGGPGGAERPLFRLHNNALEQSFVVGYLDQRGAGRSFDPAADPKRLTIARHLDDLDRVVAHLKRTFQRDKVILLGHSWGTVLGLLYAQAHPENVAGYIGVSQVVTPLAADRAQLAFLAEEARRRGDSTTLEALSHIEGPPFNVVDQLHVEHLVDAYGGLYHHKPSFALSAARAIAVGYVTPGEIKRIFQGNTVSLAAMGPEIEALDLRSQVPAVTVPVAFFVGRFDRHVEATLAAAYFQELAAPRKRLVWFEGSAHNVPFEEPARFNRAVPQVLREMGVVP